MKKALINLVVVLFAIGGLGVAMHYSEPIGGKDLPRVAREVMPGVVHVGCPFWQGSGFVVSPNVIVTARHVTDGIKDFTITTNDGHQLKATRAISNKNHDVGFIYIDDLTCVSEDCERNGLVRGKHEVHLQILELGSIDDCVLGQNVFAVGSPYGKRLNFNALTSGIISGLDRDWEMTNRRTGEPYGWSIAWTTTAPGHPGNSGCPVFTMDGRVRGVLVGGFSSTLINCMPSDLFMSELDEIELMFLQDEYQVEKEPQNTQGLVYFGT